MKITVKSETTLKSEAATGWLETGNIVETALHLAKLLGAEVTALQDTYEFEIKSEVNVTKLRARLSDADWVLYKNKSGYIAQRRKLVIVIKRRDSTNFVTVQHLNDFNLTQQRRGKKQLKKSVAY
jgi:hypothetical protein